VGRTGAGGAELAVEAALGDARSDGRVPAAAQLGTGGFLYVPPKEREGKGGCVRGVEPLPAPSASGARSLPALPGAARLPWALRGGGRPGAYEPWQSV